MSGSEHTNDEIDRLFGEITGYKPEPEQRPQKDWPNWRRRAESLELQLQEAHQDIDQLREQLAGMEALDEQLDRALTELKQLRAKRRAPKPAESAE